MTADDRAIDQPMVRRWVFRLGIVILLLVVGELVAYGSSFFLPREFAYVPPTREQFLEYLEHAEETAHMLFGWLPSEEELTPGGHRIAPNADGLTAPCVSLYGDSFTFGSEVPNDAAWGNQLIDLIGCRVDNYGVQGYGTDQAYLRFADVERDEANVVILTHFTENIVRNINQNRSLIYGESTLIKPLFTLAGDGSLRLVPRISLREDDYEGFVADPGDFLTHEYFLPNGGGLTQEVLDFPYLLSVPRYLSYNRFYLGVFSLWFDVGPWYAELYEPNHSSGALELSAAILAAFDREARVRSKIPLILVLPSIRDFNVFRDKGVWIFQPLIDVLRREGIEAINLGPRLVAHFTEKDICSYVCTRPLRRSGHYTAKGNRILAQVVSEILLARGLIEPPAQ